MLTPNFVLGPLVKSVSGTPGRVPALVRTKSALSQKVHLYLGSPASNSSNNLVEGFTLPHVVPQSWARIVVPAAVELVFSPPQPKLLSPLSTKATSNMDSLLNSCPTSAGVTPFDLISPSKFHKNGTVVNV